MRSGISSRRLALVGLMGAGKTEVGRRLAERLGWPFYDSDALVEEAAGKSVGEIFRSEGEDAFRRREGETLRRLAGLPPPLVGGMGGGVVEREENRERLARDFFVIWLRIDAEEAARRLGDDPTRPLLVGEEPARTLKTLARRREPQYREVADLRLDAGPGATPEDLCQRILEELETHVDGAGPL